MAKKSPRLNDFRSGEMTPGLGTRSDLEAYSKGCILMKNCMPLVEGGVERVPGTRFLRTVKQTEEGWGLRITRSGNGSGDVDSNPLGIDCGPTCYTFFADGASIALTAEADVGSQFVAWSGDGTGTPIRTVVMNGNKVVNAEFSIKILLDFIPFDMCTDETYLYVVGRKDYAGPNYKCKAVKISITNLAEVDSVEWELTTLGTASEYYWAVKYADGYIHIAGVANNGVRDVAIVHKRPISNLSTLTWAYTYDALTKSAWFRDLDLDDGYVYAVGDAAPNRNVLKVKLNKSDGSLVWSRNNTVSVAFGITQFSTDIYLFKNLSGLLYLEKVNKVNPDSYTEKSYLINGGLFRGMNDGTYLYCGGIQPSTGNYGCYTQKTLISDLSKTWGYQKSYSATGYEYSSRVIKHTDDIIYTCGEAALYYPSGFTTAIILQKITDAGALSLEKIFRGSMPNYDASMVITGGYLYLTCYDYTTPPFGYKVQKRHLSNLELVT